jgi:hypothetical protein
MTENAAVNPYTVRSAVQNGHLARGVELGGLNDALTRGQQEFTSRRGHARLDTLSEITARP